MNTSEIEKMLKRILEIDKAASDIEDKIMEVDMLKEKELKKKLKEIEQLKMRETRKAAKEKYDEIVGEAKAVADEIVNKGEEEKRFLLKVMQENEERIIEDAFKKLFEEIKMSDEKGSD